MNESLLIYVFFTLSIVLSVGRNMFSKNISGFKFGTYDFFKTQAMLFFSGALILLIPFIVSAEEMSLQTFCYSVIYALLLICAQWGYTAALGNGNTSVCVTLYSLGFVFPTVSGALFWGEKFSIENLFGLIAVISAVIISGKKKKSENKNTNKYLIPLIVAMLSSGGLGIMQKIQQKSIYSGQREIFILTAFVIAGIMSAISAFICRSNKRKVTEKFNISPLIAGLCFGCCNLLNTFLAGKLDSAFFFPVQNISVIIMSVVSGLIFFRERLCKKDYLVFLLGCVAIFLMN